MSKNILNGEIMNGFEGEKCFAITLGFHENIALRRLLKYSNLKRGDKIFLFSGSTIDAVMEAYESLNLYLSKIGVEPSRLVSIRVNEPHDSIISIVEALKPCRNKLIIAELGGGLRGVGMLLLFTLLSLDYKFELHSQIEGSSKSVDIPWNIIDSIKSIRTNRKDADILLKLLDVPGLSIKELAMELETNEKTIANRVSRLRKKGLIEKRGRGSPRLTLWGESIARILKLLD